MGQRGRSVRTRAAAGCASLVVASALISPTLGTPRAAAAPVPPGFPAQAETLPPPVLERPAIDDSQVDAGVVAQRIRAIKHKGFSEIGVTVVDGAGNEVYASKAEPRTPASTLKVLTGLVALDVLGPERRFETTAVRGASGRSVVLVGGGDPLLRTRSAGDGGATLSALADQTAAALKADKITAIALTFDGSLFSGPSWLKRWQERFQWSVAPITALKVDHARTKEGSLDRAKNPNGHAAEVFAGLLEKRGIKVGDKVKAAKAPRDAEVLGRVQSLPVSELVEATLRYSDNDAAETLARQVAIARGEPGSFAGAQRALVAELKRRNLWEPGMYVVDGSGISDANRVAPAALARAIRLGMAEPRLRSVITGLPVAGATGTLHDRYEDKAAKAARGRVRAKTGSIRGVDALAGYVVSADGHVLTFAFLLKGAPTPAEGRAWIDRASAVLASCGC